MSVVQEAIELATRELLIPFEGYHKKLPNGDCTSYPDPASPLANGKWKEIYPEVASAALLSPAQRTKLGQPWTIGYGNTYDIGGELIKEGDVWTQEKAIKVKEHVVKQFTRQVLAMSPSLLQEPPRRLAAVISFCYNCGMGNYRISTFRKRVEAKDWMEAYEEILKWNKAKGKVMKGLTRRRQAEGLFLLMA